MVEDERLMERDCCILKMWHQYLVSRVMWGLSVALGCEVR